MPLSNGNLRCSVITNADGTKVARWQEYSSFNMPTRIEQKPVDAAFVCPASGALPTGATTSLSFVYGPEHQRIKQVVSGGPQAGTTLYLNGPDSLDLTYERTIKSNGVTEHKHFLNLPDGAGKSGTLAQVTLRTGTLTSNPVGQQQAQETSYLHQDHIGSVMAVTNETGTVVERMAYDPWGNRRNTNGVPDPNDQLGNAAGSLYRIDRGFTLHEMLDEVGLIHMNGRVYEPALGKFMSADPMVTYPSRATSFNRYAYGMDNPLRFVDPTGFQVEGVDTNGNATGVSPENDSGQKVDQGNLAGNNQTNQVKAEKPKDTAQDASANPVENFFPEGAPIVQMGRAYGALGALVVGKITGDKNLADAGMEGLQEQKAANWEALNALVPGKVKAIPNVKGAPVFNNGWRTPDGKFAKPQGSEKPGEMAEKSVWDAIKNKPGWRVIEGRVYVRNSSGEIRVYDGVGIGPSGRGIGLEIKSGTSPYRGSQAAFDAGVSTNNPAIGVGNNKGTVVERTIMIRTP
jgi:RHS repeat-associated protein